MGAKNSDLACASGTHAAWTFVRVAAADDATRAEKKAGKLLHSRTTGADCSCARDECCERTRVSLTHGD